MKRDLVINIVLIVVGVVLAFLLFAAGVHWKSKTSTGRPTASIAGPAEQMEPLGHCRSEGKGRPHPYHPGANMGKECPRPVASGSEHYIGQVVSSCAQDGENLGREADGKGCVARGSGVCPESRYRQISAARPPPNLRTALPHCGRGTRAN